MEEVPTSVAGSRRRTQSALHTRSVPHRKAVFFCLSRGHESRVAGEWIVREDSGREGDECPVWGIRIQTRLHSLPLPARHSIDIVEQSGRCRYRPEGPGRAGSYPRQVR